MAKKTTKKKTSARATRIPGLIVRGERLQLRVFVDGKAKYQALTSTITDPPDQIASEAARLRASLSAPKTMTIDDYIGQYIVARSLKAASVKSLRRALQGYTIDNDTTNARQADRLMMSEYKDSTKRLYMERVDSFYRWIIGQGVAVKNPIAGRRPPKHVESYTHKCSIEDAEAMIEATDSSKYDDDRLFVRLMRYTGARVSTIYAVSAATFRRTEDGAYYATLYNVKTSRAYRSPIYIDDMTTCQLLDERIGAGIDPFWRDSFRAITLRIGRRMKKINPNMTPHSFRHLFATELRQKGVALDIVSRLLDHSGIAITLKTYAEHSQDQLDEAVKMI